MKLTVEVNTTDKKEVLAALATVAARLLMDDVVTASGALIPETKIYYWFQLSEQDMWSENDPPSILSPVVS